MDAGLLSIIMLTIALVVSVLARRLGEWLGDRARQRAEEKAQQDQIDDGKGSKFVVPSAEGRRTNTGQSDSAYAKRARDYAKNHKEDEQ